MGFADALVRMGIPYDTPEGVEMGRRVMEFLDVESKKESERLADERGPFPEWARSIFGPDETCARDADGNRIRPMQKLRNCNVTTVAPTGTISIIAGCSSGLEPLFAVAFMRRQADMEMPDVNPEFVRIARDRGFYSEDLMRAVAEHGGGADVVLPAVKRVAHQLRQHLWQRGVEKNANTARTLHAQCRCRARRRVLDRFGEQPPQHTRGVHGQR